jgi:competence protein ComEC
VGIPLGLAVALAVGAVAARRPALICLGVALLAASLGQRSVAGLDATLATGPVGAEVTLVSDAAPDGRGGVTVDVRLDGRHLRARARATAAAALEDRLAGERVVVVGEVEPPGSYERFLRDRHIAGRLRVDAVAGWRAGGGVSRLANGLRRTLAAGSSVLPDRQASLLAGLTLGDDRDQPADMTDAFRAAGLTHLLAVSGQNVAFAMVVAAPVLRRLRFGPRVVAALAVLAGFALLTRWEPSVLRATAMAAVAATGSALGRPATAGRTLAVGVTLVLLVDPLLAMSLGFRLSVAGAAGILAGAPRLEAVLPGPRWLTAPVSVTAAAQLAVAPLLVATFGSIPLASLPANLLAVPAAGPVMVWGLTGGLVAGLAGGPVAEAIHVPTRLLLAWIDGVASAAARWPLGELGAIPVACLVAAAMATVAVRHHAAEDADRANYAGPARPRLPSSATSAVRWSSGLVVAAVLLHATLATAPAPPDGRGDVGIGATVWQGGGAAVLVLDGRAESDRVLAGMRDRGVGRVDVVVLRTAASSAVGVASVVQRRWPAALVLAPGGSPVEDGGLSQVSTPRAGTVLDIGGLRLEVRDALPDRLDVAVDTAPAGSPPDVRSVTDNVTP